MNDPYENNEDYYKESFKRQVKDLYELFSANTEHNFERLVKEALKELLDTVNEDIRDIRDIRD